MPGQAKNTYGTGCFLLMHTGHEACAIDAQARDHRGGLGSGAGPPSTRSRAACSWPARLIQWLTRRARHHRQRRRKPTPSARRVATTRTASTWCPRSPGLGAPSGMPTPAAPLYGLTRGTGAAPTSCARRWSRSRYRGVRPGRVAMEADAACRFQRAATSDGGAPANDFLMQFQADMLGAPLRRPDNAETTALGAAYLAGLSTGFWKARESWRPCGEDRFAAHLRRAACAPPACAAWHEAVSRVRS
ncbi:MAG: FGGY-family carbohydrate kinase [Adlercreutzia equolifaciens]